MSDFCQRRIALLVAGVLLAVVTAPAVADQKGPPPVAARPPAAAAPPLPASAGEPIAPVIYGAYRSYEKNVRVWRFVPGYTPPPHSSSSLYVIGTPGYGHAYENGGAISGIYGLGAGDKRARKDDHLGRRDGRHHVGERHDRRAPKGQQDRRRISVERHVTVIRLTPARPKGHGGYDHGADRHKGGGQGGHGKAKASGGGGKVTIVHRQRQVQRASRAAHRGGRGRGGARGGRGGRR